MTDEVTRSDSGVPESGETAESVEATKPASLSYLSISPEPLPAANAPAGRTDFAVIGLRVLSVYFIATALPGVVALPFAYLGEVAALSVLLVGAATPLLSLGIGLTLWFASRPLARMMLSDIPSTTGLPRSRTTASQVQSIAFSVVGLVLMAYAMRHVADLVKDITAPDDVIYDRSDAARLSAIDLAVEMAVGASIFFGARGLSHLWYKLRATP